MIAMNRALFLAVCLSMSSSSYAHPHNDPPKFGVIGTVTKVSPDTRTVEVDAFDRKGQFTRNYLIFIDRQTKIRKGKERLTLAALSAGQRIDAFVENEAEPERTPRLVAIEIRLDEPRPSSAPATR